MPSQPNHERLRQNERRFDERLKEMSSFLLGNAHYSNVRRYSRQENVLILLELNATISTRSISLLYRNSSQELSCSTTYDDSS